MVGHRQHGNRGIMLPTTAQHILGGLRKIKCTVVSQNSGVIVVDNVGGLAQIPTKTVPHMDLRVADVAKKTTG